MFRFNYQCNFILILTITIFKSIVYLLFNPDFVVEIVLNFSNAKAGFTKIKVKKIVGLLGGMK